MHALTYLTFTSAYRKSGTLDPGRGIPMWDPGPGIPYVGTRTRDPNMIKWDSGPGTPKFSCGTRDPGSLKWELGR